jgi:hypothetical protein
MDESKINTVRDVKNVPIIDSMECPNKIDASSGSDPKVVPVERSNEPNLTSTPDTKVKQQTRPQKPSIKQQLQQAALQKIQQQQARHAMNMSKNNALKQKSANKTAEEQVLKNNTKARTEIRPKTPQSLGKKSVEAFTSDSALITNTEIHAIPPACVPNSESTVSGLDVNELRGSSSGKQDDTRSLINSIPIAFWFEGLWHGIY